MVPRTLSARYRAHPVVSVPYVLCYVQVAVVYKMLGGDEGSRKCEELAAWTVRNCPQNLRAVSHARRILGTSFAERGEWSEARGYFEDSIRAAERFHHQLWVILALRDWQQAVPQDRSTITQRLETAVGELPFHVTDELKDRLLNANSLHLAQTRPEDILT